MTETEKQEQLERVQELIALRSKEKKKIILLYLIFSLSVFAIFMPSPHTSVFAIMITSCILSGLYSIRNNAEEDSLTENHMGYLIYTFWRTMLYIFFFSFIGSIYFVIMLNYEPIKPCYAYLEKHMGAMIQHGNFGSIAKVLNLCKEGFLAKNRTHIYVACLVSFGPSFAYYTFHVIRGGVLVIHENIARPHKR